MFFRSKACPLTCFFTFSKTLLDAQDMALPKSWMALFMTVHRYLEVLSIKKIKKCMSTPGIYLTVSVIN